jgi:uncharacterized oxidoreductase
MNLTAHTVLVTGGATGIGLALAEELSERGNRVIVCGRSSEALLKARAVNPDLIGHVCDITDTTSRQAMVEWLNAAHPDLSMLINNAGVQYRRIFGEDCALNDLEQEIATNFTAPVRLIDELLPLLRRQPKAVVVNVSSGLAFSPLASVPVYSATKAAVHSFTLSLRHQLRTTSIRVVEMAPPMVDTGLGNRDPNGHTSSPRMMTPKAFARDAIAQLENGRDEVLVGMAANTRAAGEAFFERMNGI